MTHYQILPPEQKAILPSLAATRDLGYALYGGTAIGLQLGHRESIDFDFFNERRPSRADLLSKLPNLAKAEVLQDEPDTWTVLARSRNASRPVKISFFSGLSFGRVGMPQLAQHGEVVIASLADLFGHKLKTLLQRVEAKDYQDIAAMLRAGQQLENGAGAAMSLFGRTFPVADALRALVHFQDRQLEQLSKEDRRTLVEAVEKFSTARQMPRLSNRLVGDKLGGTDLGLS